MFIDHDRTRSLSPVGTICPRSTWQQTYRSYGTQEGWTTFFYKHIVPTELKKLPKYFLNLNQNAPTMWRFAKLTPIGNFL